MVSVVASIATAPSRQPLQTRQHLCLSLAFLDPTTLPQVGCVLMCGLCLDALESMTSHSCAHVFCLNDCSQRDGATLQYTCQRSILIAHRNLTILPVVSAAHLHGITVCKCSPQKHTLLLLQTHGRPMYPRHRSQKSGTGAGVSTSAFRLTLVQSRNCMSYLGHCIGCSITFALPNTLHLTAIASQDAVCTVCCRETSRWLMDGGRSGGR